MLNWTAEMRRTCVVLLLCAVAFSIRVNGKKFPHRDSHLTKHAKWEEVKDEKRDVTPSSYDYTDSQYAASSSTGQQTASYSPSAYTNSETTGSQKSAMPAAYPAASPSRSPAPAAVSSASPAAAAPAAYPSPAVAASARSSPAASPSPAPARAASPAPASSPAPAASPAAAAPAAYPSPAAAASARSSPAAAPSPAASPAASAAPAPYALPASASNPVTSRAPSPAPAAAAPAPYSSPYPSVSSATSASARSSPASAPYPAPSPAPAYNPSLYQGTSVSSSYAVNPPAPAAYSYYPAPAPAPVLAPAPASAFPEAIELDPRLTATAQIAAFVADIAKSTSGKGSAKGHGRSNIHINATMCADDNRADNFCRKAYTPCFCEENHHFMFNYCKRSCNWCDSSEMIGHKYWRIVNSAKLSRSWTINEVKFFSDKSSSVPLLTDPAKAYASSSYMGYLPSNAFDGKTSTYWLPDGWYQRDPGMDYIGFEFDNPVSINSIEVIHQNQSSVTSKKMMIEASDYYDGPYNTKWIMENPEKKQDMRFSNRMCPLFWRRFATDVGTYCFRQMSDMVSWREARDRCAKYGADLTSITGPEESAFLRNDVQPCGYTWIGLNDIKNESNFEWSDGKDVSFKAYANEEEYMAQDDRLNEMQDCIAMSRTGEWHNFNCDDKFYFICKLKLRPTEYHDPVMKRTNHLKKLKKLTANMGHVHNETPKPVVEEDESSGSYDEEDEDNTEDAIHERHHSKESVTDSEFVEEEEEEDASSASGSGHRSTPEKSGDNRDEIQKVWEF